MYCKELLETVRINLCYQEPSAKGGVYLAREHLGITTGNKDSIFSIGHPSGKLMPRVYVLHFIKKKHRALAVHLLMTLQQFVEVLSIKVLQTLILKVQIEHFVPLMTRSHALLQVHGTGNRPTPIHEVQQHSVPPLADYP